LTGRQGLLNSIPILNIADPRTGATVMLVIRPDQFGALENEATRDFVRRAVEHLRAELPEWWGRMSAAGAEAAVRDGLRVARDLRFDTEGAVVRFLEVVPFFGPDFGTLARHGLAVQALRDPRVVAEWPASRATVVALKGVIA